MHVASTEAGDRYRHRLAHATVTVRDASGRPMRDARVTVQQRRHAFAFGNIGFDFLGLPNGEHEPAGPRSGPFSGARAEAARRLEPLFLDLFNTATLPIYWAGFEPERGRPQTERLAASARWFRERDVELKGHPLAWHTLVPDWLLALPASEVEDLLRQRITREVTAFRGLVDTWDAINEAVIMPVFANGRNAITPLAQRLGRVGMVRLAVETARAADPGATLLVNDFDLSPAYERLLEDCLEAGIGIDAIGLQTHMHQGYVGEERTLATLERFARFGLPLHLTETTLVSGDVMPPEIVDLNDYQVPSWPSTAEGEAQQADELVRHYRTLVEHPAVAAITYWGLTDEGAWLGAPAGLVRADGSPKPGYDALRSLIKGDWWLAATALATDAHGRVVIEGFAGRYEIASDGATATVELEPGATAERSATLRVASGTA
jgi:GH35 family endo-1,4-beta-xylanase